MSEPGVVEAVRDELRRERIPVLHFRKLDEETLEQRLSQLGDLVQQLGTRKLALLRRRGGFRPLVGKRADAQRADAQLSVAEGRISIINLTTDGPRILPSMLSKRDSELAQRERPADSIGGAEPAARQHHVAAQLAERAFPPSKAPARWSSAAASSSGIPATRRSM